MKLSRVPQTLGLHCTSCHRRHTPQWRVGLCFTGWLMLVFRSSLLHLKVSLEMRCTVIAHSWYVDSSSKVCCVCYLMPVYELTNCTKNANTNVSWLSAQCLSLSPHTSRLAVQHYGLHLWRSIQQQQSQWWG